MQGGEIIELVSDLGGGKTAFVRGLAKGMGSKDKVHSPSFTLTNEYKAKDLTLYHFDFYRLNEPGIMRDQLTEAVNNPKGVVAVEWPAIIEDVLPLNRLIIKIHSTSPTHRQYIFQYPQTLSHIIPGNT